MKHFARKRHILKSITWRTIGTLDTILLSYILTGNISMGLKIGGIELFTKMLLYYLHERAWYHLDVFKEKSSRVRHILKTFTWRFIGSVDTMIIGWFITKSAEIGMSLGALEVVSKMILYYLHERVWYKSNFGLLPEVEGENEVKK
ncbi:MAG: DUF2061 domain-containing protein [Bacteroidetes bacterium]|nr:DUF2061 domain-containing protein [Bacteroidota bacterium]